MNVTRSRLFSFCTSRCYTTLPKTFTTTKSKSSNAWLNRQRNDAYVQQAKKEGYRSRAAFKLTEIDDKYKFLNKCNTIVELGAAPGSWTEVAVERMKHGGKIITIDLLDMAPLETDRVECIQIRGDFTERQYLVQIAQHLRNEDGQITPVDAVLSDMAPNTSGIGALDHGHIIDLCVAAYKFSTRVLKPNGILLLKFFQGGELQELKEMLKEHFQEVVVAKPKSSRSESKESFLLCTGFKKPST